MVTSNPNKYTWISMKLLLINIRLWQPINIAKILLTFRLTWSVSNLRRSIAKWMGYIYGYCHSAQTSYEMLRIRSGMLGPHVSSWSTHLQAHFLITIEGIPFNCQQRISSPEFNVIKYKMSQNLRIMLLHADIRMNSSNAKDSLVLHAVFF